MNITSTPRMTIESRDDPRSGFTIIEVVLVLAIAGLIFLMVFVALPALQRSQRDTQRRDDMARLVTAITNYQTNNNNKLPGSSGSWSSSDSTNFINSYLGGSDEFQDPLGGDYTISVIKCTSAACAGTGINDFDSSDEDVRYAIAVYTNAQCDDEKAVYNSNANNYAVVYNLEGSGTSCTD